VAEINRHIQYETKREMEEQLTKCFQRVTPKSGPGSRLDSDILSLMSSTYLTSAGRKKSLIILCLIKSLTVDGCKLGKAHGKDSNLSGNGFGTYRELG
jgi:hypothetical protein